MQRSLLVGLILVVAAILGAAFWFSRGDTAPPPPVGSTRNEAPAPVDPAVTTATAPAGEASTRRAERQIAATVAAALRDDPEIQAGLTGVKGRVVDHAKTPVAGCGVRLYRGALDTVLVEGMDLFAEQPEFEPDYVAGETKTAEDGRFEIHGVWPRAIFVLFAGIGTDAPVHQIVTRTPSPGEVVDLGDIVLPDAGVITGTVLDDDGEPLAGALVRAADVPGTLAAFFPVERFDPQGALLIREPQSPIRVLEMPRWVKKAFDDLPIPSTTTGTDGAFRLVGVTPGSNMLAVTIRDFLSDVKPSVQVRAGQVKDVGRIKLRRGEELVGRVVDTAGEPVPNAEVFAGSTLSVAPVDLAQAIGKADADGRFEGRGFAPGKVSVAARRGKGHAWVLAEPQSINGDVLVTLPAAFAATVAVTKADGTPAKEARFKLLQGKPGQGVAEMHMLGFSPAIDLRDRQKPTTEGRWRIENLLAGDYTLLADAPGHAVAFAYFRIVDAEVAVDVRLEAPKVFAVRVLGDTGQPIRNARIFAEARQDNLQDMATLCGRTDAEGRLTIESLRGETARVSAEHPRWGAAHGEAKLTEELVLRMQQPGSLRGTIRENGKPPTPGKFTVGLYRLRGGSEERGPLEDVPRLVTPAVDGTFTVAALQPGTWDVSGVNAIDGLRSPGGVFEFMKDLRFFGTMERTRVEVVSGQQAVVELEVGEKPLEGPTGTLAGTVTIDGRLGAGCIVTLHTESRRAAARVDERGRFDLGVVKAGTSWMNVEAPSDDSPFGNTTTVWSGNCKVKEAEANEVTIDITTSSMSGNVSWPDGTPASGCHVQAHGMLKAGSGADSKVPGTAQAWLGAPTDANGNFRFDRVPEGTWTLTAQGGHDRERPAKAVLADVVVRGGSPSDDLRIVMKDSIVVKGRVDLSSFGGTKPQWAWLGFYRVTADTPPTETGEHVDGAGVDMENGEFSTSDLPPGRYRVRFHVAAEGRRQQQYEVRDVEIPPTGLTDLVLQPGRLLP